MMKYLKKHELPLILITNIFFSFHEAFSLCIKAI